MLHKIVFDDEITLWWTLEEFSSGEYEFYLNGEYHGRTTKTHYSFIGLQAEQNYEISLRVKGVDGYTEKREIVVKTSPTKRRIDVTQAPYYAVGDGKTLNTKAIQRALNDCCQDELIYFPEGEYLTGSLNVHSNTEIYLEVGAILQGTDRVEDYLPKIKSRFEGIEMECYSSLLNLGTLDRNDGYNCESVVIRGGGTISGGGLALANAIIESEKQRLESFLKENAEYVKTCENERTIPGRARGRLINMSNCQNIIIAGVTMQYGPSWNIHMIYSKDIVTYGCKVISKGVWNGDGWNPDSSENCVIFDTVFDTGDDCVAIKSGKNPEGNYINRPCFNIFVFDCKAFEGHGMSIGSEISGGIHSVYVWDCDFKNTWYGLNIKGTKKRGGYVKNVNVKNCIFSCVLVWCVSFNDDGEGSKYPPLFCDYTFENIILAGTDYFQKIGVMDKKRYVFFNGFEEKEYYIQNILFKNIKLINTPNAEVFELRNTNGIVLKDVFFVNR